MASNISQIEVKATPEKIWEILTSPEKVKLWQYGSELLTDWKVGSRVSFTNKWEDKVFEQYGTVLEFNPNKSLKYSLFFPKPDLEDKPENYFKMEYVLTQHGANTLVKIIQEDNRPGAKQEAPQGEENPIMKALKTLIES
tara:strand:+ start:309 stop:728 length:420 start_codon:yes stop_codon:yes gene_type:complete